MNQILRLVADYLQPNLAAIWGELYRVAQQIDQDLRQPPLIGTDGVYPCIKASYKFNFLGARCRFNDVQAVATDHPS